ncbi:MAG: TetR family transcriptional regulator [Anaerolineae bacterium]|nr:TetR family transcriptional regulator [Anaerolineae bacterium]
MPRRPADQTVSRDDILAAAARVFHERGYHGATMGDISAAVGLTAGSLYHHFKGGKEALLIAVLEFGLAQVTTDVQAIAESALAPEEKLRLAIRAHILSVTEHVAVAALMIFEMRTTLSLPDVPERYLARRDAFENLYRQMITEGIAQGVFRPVDVGVFTRTLLGASNWVSVWYRPSGRLSGEAIADQIAGIFLASLLVG